MRIPPLFYILLLFILGCSQAPNLKKENQDFYQLAQRAKTTMLTPEYKRWLQNKREGINTELAAMGGQESREGRVLDQHDLMTEGSTTVGGPQDIHGFKADRSRQSLKRLDNRKKMLERHLFYINSQLSQLDSSLKY
jgi:hypothetical protein